METTVAVTEASQVAEVRRLVAEMTTALGLSEADAGRAALVATEVSTNLVKYARQGVVSVCTYDDQRGHCGVQILATDPGPGIADLAQAERDGHSTAGSMGIGLGSMRRASDLFEIYSVAGQGTVVLSRIGKPVPRAQERGPARLSVGARSVPMPGQTHCGDAWSAVQVGRSHRICLVDGLGHGPVAGRAAATAMGAVLGAAESTAPEDLLALAHNALRSTRGAVMAVVTIDVAQGLLKFAGVGNVMGLLYGGEKVQHLLSVEGTAGYQMRRVRPAAYPWHSASVLVLWTDGLSTRVNLARYPGLATHHPAIAASVLLRDFNRNSDDATVLVVKGMP